MNHIEKVKELMLPANQFVLVGGSVLDIHKIRKSDDIDMVVSPKAFTQLQERGWKLDEEFSRKWGRERLTNDVFEVVTGLNFEYCDYIMPFQILLDMSHVIEGVHVQPLGMLILGKKDMGREKDLKDIALIENYFGVQ